MKSTTFVLFFIGLTILGGMGYVLGRIAFMTYPDVDNVFSIVWTVVLGLLLFVGLRHTLKASTLKTPAERRRQVYGMVISLCEVCAFATLIFVAIVFSNVATTPGNEGLLPLILVTGASAVGLLLFSGIMRIVTGRGLATEN